MKIVHLVHGDKFTVGYVRFMQKKLKQYDHVFFIHNDSSNKYNFVNELSGDNISFVDNYNELLKDNRKEVLELADLIIITGFFWWKEMKPFIRRKILHKTYIQLWGGDFYCLKNNTDFKERIRNQIRKYFLTNAGGIINLIPGDYDELCKFCSPKGKHFVAPMAGDGTIQQLVADLHNTEKSKKPLQIILGNSATESNQHFEILEKLRRFKDKDIQIICPLSYGDAQYAESVIKLGKDIFGDNFVALTEFMDVKSYYEYIARSTVAIYNNNRQQAMGNINASLGMGCKVYIRSDTPMWNTYSCVRGYTLYNVEDIDEMSFDEFVDNSKDIDDNYKVFQKNCCVDSNVNKWLKVFASIEEKK